MKIPIPDDWNGEDWQCVQISWPKSDLWLALLHGLLSSTMRGRYWDERTGTIKDAQAVGWEIWMRNTPLVDCASEPIPPDNGGGGSDVPGSSIYAPMGGALEDLEMPCFDISGLLKIENGHLYARDSCCEWQDIGSVGTVEDLPVSLWDGSDPAPTYYACAKADAVIDAMLAVINGVFDAAGDWNPLSWIGTVEGYIPGYNLSNTVVASMLAQVAIAAAIGISQSDMTDADKVQTLKCQFVSLLQSDNTGVSISQYDALSGILSGVFGLVSGNMWLLAKAALGRGNVNNIAIAAGTNADADCACPEAVPFGTTDPSINGWYLGGYHEELLYPRDTGFGHIIQDISSPHDVFGVVLSVLKTNAGGAYYQEIKMLTKSTSGAPGTVLWDVDASETIGVNQAWGYNTGAFAEVLGAGAYTFLATDGVDFGTIAAPTFTPGDYQIGWGTKQVGSEGAFAKVYGLRLLHNTGSPSHT